MYMADWEHKERTWNINSYSDLEGSYMQNQDSSIQRGNPRSFTEWLDWQCEGGWEVIKISRKFNDFDRPSWCVFRRKIRV